MRGWRKMNRSGERGYRLCGILFIGLLMLASCAPIHHLVVEQVATNYPEAIFYIPTNEPLVALTFDDVPDSVTTPLILNTLRKYHAHATFFVITGRVPGNEAIIQRILAEGHEIGNHMTRDEPTAKLTYQKFVQEFNRADSVLRQFAPVRWLRPGSAFYTEEMANYLANDPRGYRLVLGSVYPADAQIPFTFLASHYIDWTTRPGDIIVLHDGGDRGRRTIRTLEQILPYLTQKGLKIVTISTLYQHGLKNQSGVKNP